MSDKNSLLVLGGTSDIGRATALTFAKRGWTIRLAGRDQAALKRESDDISTRTGVPVSTHHFDVLQTDSFPAFVAALPTLPDAVVCVIGLLGDQGRGESDAHQATLIVRSNFEGPSLILGLFAEQFLARGSGTIVGVSSVAGDRGRASNYIYGSSKSGFTAFLSGLRNRCAQRNVHVVTVKPGFVRTKMTHGMKLPALLTCNPATVEVAIERAARARRNVVYVSPVWRLIMLIIKSIPESKFKRMSI